MSGIELGYSYELGSGWTRIRVLTRPRKRSGTVMTGLEIVAPGLSCFYDGQHLFIMNRIISFGRGHGV